MFFFPLAGFRRWAVKDFTLSTGLTIRRGQAITADTLHMMDGFGETYENPLEFDPYRFLNMRSTPGKVSISPSKIYSKRMDSTHIRNLIADSKRRNPRRCW